MFLKITHVPMIRILYFLIAIGYEHMMIYVFFISFGFFLGTN